MPIIIIFYPKMHLSIVPKVFDRGRCHQIVASASVGRTIKLSNVNVTEKDHFIKVCLVQCDQIVRLFIQYLAI